MLEFPFPTRRKLHYFTFLFLIWVLLIGLCGSAQAQGGLIGGVTPDGNNNENNDTETDGGLDEVAGPSTGGIVGPLGNVWPERCSDEARKTKLAKKYPEFCGADVPPPEVMTWMPFEGFWKIVTSGDDGLAETRVEIYRVTSKPKPDFRARGFWISSDGDGKFFKWHSPTDVKINGQKVEFTYGKSNYGHWYRQTFTANIGQGETTVKGNWNEKKAEKSGGAIWKKKPPIEIKTVRIRRAGSTKSGGKTADTYLFGRRAGVISRQHPVTCRGARGNCSTVSVDLLGKNFGGKHKFWIDPAYRVELDRWRYICRDGNTRTGDYQCKNPKKHPTLGVAGITLTLNLWDGIRPGPMNIWVDGVPIPIYLDITDFLGDDTNEPEIIEFHPVNSLGEVLEALVEHSPFRLRAKFDEPSPRPWFEVEMPDVATVSEIDNLPNSDGVIFDRRDGTIILRPDAERLVYTSDLLAIVEKGN